MIKQRRVNRLNQTKKKFGWELIKTSTKMKKKVMELSSEPTKY